MPDEQLTFSGQAEPAPASQEQYPPDVVEALNIVTGNAPEPMGDPSQIRPSEQQDLIKAGLLKNSDPRKTIHKAEDYFIRSYDIANEEEAQEMARQLNLVGNPVNSLTGRQSPVVHLLDTNCARGFRSLVTLEYWKVTSETKIVANR